MIPGVAIQFVYVILRPFLCSFDSSLMFTFPQILFPVIYCTIVYFMTDQPNEGLRYTQFLSVTILTCLVAQSIGLLIGTVAPSLPVSTRLSNVIQSSRCP